MSKKNINMAGALLIGQEVKQFALGGFGAQMQEFEPAQGAQMLQQSPPGVLFLFQLASKGDQQIGAVTNNIALKLERVAKACSQLVGMLPAELQETDEIRGLDDVVKEFERERAAMEAAMAQARSNNESKGDA